MKTLSHEEELRTTVRLMQISLRLYDRFFRDKISEDDIDFLRDYVFDHTDVLAQQYRLFQLSDSSGEQFSEQYLLDMEFIHGILGGLTDVGVVLPNEPRSE